MSVASSCVVNMNKILTYIDGNEIPHDRCRLLEEAIGKDDHFSLIKEHKELLFDLLCQLPRPEGHGLPLRKKSRGVRVADSSC